MYSMNLLSRHYICLRKKDNLGFGFQQDVVVSTYIMYGISGLVLVWVFRSVLLQELVENKYYYGAWAQKFMKHELYCILLVGCTVTSLVPMPSQVSISTRIFWKHNLNNDK
jgi:hypothetical protein